MKVAVSIPDDVFVEAEELVRQMKTSRSELYARALAAFVCDHDRDRVTEAMNQVVDAVGSSRDQFTGPASRRIFDRIEW